MSLTTTARRIQYTLSSTNQALSFPYYFLANSDLAVVKTDPSTFVDTQLTITTHYTVTGAGVGAGGTVTMVNGTVGDIITIYGIMPQTQPISLTAAGQLPSAAMTQAYDRVTMLIQQLTVQMNHCLRTPPSNADLAVMLRVDRASKVVAFDADGAIDLTNSIDSIVAQAATAAQASSAFELSAKVFGATGDGVTDDTTLLQQVLTSAAGLTVNLGDGNTYLISSQLTLPEGVTIRGKSKIKAKAASVIGSMIYATGKSRIRLEDFEVDGNADNTGARNGIHLASGTGNLVFRAYVHDTIEAGLRIESEDGTSVLANRCINCGRSGYTDNHGIMVFANTGTVQNILVSGNTVLNAYRKGITTYSATPGVAKNIRLVFNDVRDCATGGIYCANAPATTDQAGLVVADNLTVGNYVNIEIVNVDGFTCTGNVCRDDTHFGMAITDSSNGVVADNQISDSEIHGLLVNGSVSVSTNITLIGNSVIRPNRSTAGTGVGLYLSGATYCFVDGNFIFDAASGTKMTHGLLEDSTSANNRFGMNRVVNATAALITTIGQGVTLANGDNNNISLALIGEVYTAGPTGAYAITGISGGYHGREVTIVNYVAQTMTIAHNSGSSSAGNKILVGGSADLAIAVYGAVTLRYLAGPNAWFVVGYKA